MFTTHTYIYYVLVFRAEAGEREGGAQTQIHIHTFSLSRRAKTFPGIKKRFLWVSTF